jgi:hypothetical protein
MRGPQILKIFSHPYYLERRFDLPEQYPIGWVGDSLYALISDLREDMEGEYEHLVTLWKATSGSNSSMKNIRKQKKSQWRRRTLHVLPPGRRTCRVF